MRNMMYSLTQQLVRQDPGYWLVYTLLRSDHSYRLISYPYYTKSQQPGDPTAFRHIDYNIESMAAGRGVRQIQGSLSLDDEYADDCTEIVPGMHRHLLDWCSTLHQRGLASHGYIQAIEGDTLTEEDLEKYGTRWVPVPCKAGEIRVTDPRIPHGALGPAVRPRRTILPWYVAENEDGDMEVQEAGGREELAHAHATFTPPPRSPSGHPNMYGKMDTPFAANVHLDGLGPISDALIGRRQWTDPEVSFLVFNLLLHPESTATKLERYLQNWIRRDLLRLVFDRPYPYRRLHFRAAPSYL